MKGARVPWWLDRDSLKFYAMCVGFAVVVAVGAAVVWSSIRNDGGGSGGPYDDGNTYQECLQQARSAAEADLC